MGLFDIFKVKQYKKQIQEQKKLIEKLTKEKEVLSLTKEELKVVSTKEKLEQLEKQQYELISDTKNKLKGIEDEINRLTTVREELEQNIDDLKSKLTKLEFDFDMESFAVYENYYNLGSSEEYKDKIREIKEQQKHMIKNKTATNHNMNWTVNGNRTQGKKMVNDTIKMAIRAINTECDNLIAKATYQNIYNLEGRMQKVLEQVNKLVAINEVEVRYSYLELKQEELRLKHEYECKKQEEKEEQQALKERMRDEAQALKEIEREEAKIEKEEKHYIQALEKARKEMKLLDKETEAFKALQRKIDELESKLKEIDNNKQALIERKECTRAGFVYIISNIGSFGEDVYKIGMTRRLDPTERVRELGGASVPFKFDIHATIFAFDAPKLERNLHKRLSEYQVNKMNNRKEFFKVNLSYIEQVVKEEFKEASIRFSKIALAEEYRQTLAIENELNQQQKQIS
ncbi:MAG: DUF4041 domain-containing protein [Clostridia bacterium]